MKIYEKIRKPTAKGTIPHKDKSKYTRKGKHMDNKEIEDLHRAISWAYERNQFLAHRAVLSPCEATAEANEVHWHDAEECRSGVESCKYCPWEVKNERNS